MTDLRLEIERTICLLSSLPTSLLVELRIARLEKVLESLGFPGASFAADPFERVLSDVARVSCRFLRC